MALNNLSADEVEQAELLLVDLLQEAYPSADLTPGRVLRDLVVHPAAMFYALHASNLRQLQQSMSLLTVSQHPELASNDLVDGLLSNLLLERKAGQTAGGQIRVILSRRLVTPIDAGATFIAGGELSFRTTTAFVGVTSSTNVVSPGSRLITERGDGYYEFLIDVRAVQADPEHNVAAGTRFTTAANVPYLIDLLAADDFSGGRAAEDNAALVAKAQRGLAPRVLSGRAHIEALLHEHFPELLDVTIVGAGDSEMRRDAHNLFGVGQGGRVDIYVQTAEFPRRAVVTTAATMLDPATRTLTFNLDRDTAAGAYAVLAVYRAAESPFVPQGEGEPTLLDSLPILSTVWTLDDTAAAGTFVPALTSAAEAAFTRYRRVAVTFTDGQSSLAAGETAEYQVHLLRMPLVADIQDFVNDRARRSPGTDYLVRAAVPVLCSVGAEVRARYPSEVDTGVLARAAANRIQAGGFALGHLPGSLIVDAIQGQLSSDAVMDLPLSLLGKLYLPDGSTRTLTGTDELRLPTVTVDPLVTARTTIFFLRLENVTINLKALTS